MKLLATWMTSAEIAGQLHVSQNTAKSHIYAIYRKLGVSSRREAVAAARELGYIP
jgi:LuxR family maltose regulon positive regulatory protein